MTATCVGQRNQFVFYLACVFHLCMFSAAVPVLGGSIMKTTRQHIAAGTSWLTAHEYWALFVLFVASCCWLIALGLTVLHTYLAVVGATYFETMHPAVDPLSWIA